MRKIVVIGGDGIGPEVISSASSVLESLGLDLELVTGEMGLACFERTGSYLPQATIDLLEESDACLFGAITSPCDADYRSPLLYLRRRFDLFANLRPVRRLHPSIGLLDLDVVIVRENTEGMYTGLEHEDELGVTTARRVSEAASRRIIRFAIDMCRRDRRRRITCAHKANVLTKSDGLFRKVFLEEMQGSGLEAKEMFVDAVAAALVLKPRELDCIVTLNLYGDILSDEAAALIGGLGFAPSANLGKDFGIFEPCHGSAPDIAGKGLANPIAAILSAAMMLRFLKEEESAARVEEAAKTALERGLRTPDIGGSYSTSRFTEKLIRILDGG